MYQSRISNGKKRTNRYEKHRALEEPEEGQSYAIVQDLIGNGRLRALCSDSVVRLAKIRGSLRKTSHKIIIEKNDLILVSFRDFEPDKVDVLHKYTYDEANLIMNTFELPECIQRAWNMTDKYTNNKEDGDQVVFVADNEIIDNKHTSKGYDTSMYPPSDDSDIDDSDIDKI
jgi:translation initiation factor 1A